MTADERIRLVQVIVAALAILGALPPSDRS